MVGKVILNLPDSGGNMEIAAKFVVAFSDVMEIFVRTENKMIRKFSGANPKIVSAAVKTIGSLLLLLLAPLLLIILFLVAFSLMDLPVDRGGEEDTVRKSGYRDGMEGYGYYYSSGTFWGE